MLVLMLALVAAAGPRTYVVDPAQSSVSIHVDKAGLLKAAGHEHDVAAGSFRGSVVADEDDLSRSSVELTFEAGALRVVGSSGPAKDVPEVQATMVGPKVLDVSRFPEIGFRSRRVEGARVSAGVFDLEITGDLTLRGVARTIVLPMRVTLSSGTLTANGRTRLEQTAFGIKPVTAGAGLVKVKDAVEIEYRIVARPGP